MLSKIAVDEFKRIFKEEFNEDITDAQALGLGVNLLTSLNKVYRPIKKSWLSDLNKKLSDYFNHKKIK